VDIMHTCHEASNKQCPVRALFVDYSKAFEHGDHNVLVNKLSQLDLEPFIIKWITSFLSRRQQRVKIGNVMSNWSTMIGGMPQGTWLGVYFFLVYINDLKSSVTLFKFIDDITAIERIDKPCSSNMQSVADEMIDWSNDNLMKFNIKKTKDMIIDFSLNKVSPALINVNDQSIQRVSSFRLLGVIVMNTLCWDEHVTSICSKASKRLYFLKLLKKSSLSSDDLLHYYKYVIRSVIEYACPVWQSGLTNEQLDKLENIQRRAIRIISGSNDYEFNCVIYSIELISVRLDNLSRKFFTKICRPSDCLRTILPAERDVTYTQRLRRVTKYPEISGRTERYINSFIPYALANYQ
jgi:ribonuclease P/MRP protein subunit RPP40